ncbi:MAG: hypothetical protein FWG75_03885 [Cystobacterineae bacterium]|nr:hypothetical protein [Cystobacterineae bacterium]
MKNTFLMPSLFVLVAVGCGHGQRGLQGQNSEVLYSAEHGAESKTRWLTDSDFESWGEYQAYLRNEILKRMDNQILKESFLQEMYIRNVVRISNDELFVLIPFNLHSLDCGAPDCYSTDVSFSFKLGNTLRFPEILAFQEHEHGCVPQETTLSGHFQKIENTEQYLIYHSEEHKRTLVLLNNPLRRTAAYYFRNAERDTLSGQNLFEIIENYSDDEPQDLELLRSWVLTTPEYSLFLP